MLPIIVVAMVGNSPLLNALLIWDILYNIEALCKHLHNKQQLGCQPIMKLRFHKSRKDKHLSSSMLLTICTIANSTNLTYLGKLVIKMQDVVTSCHILVRGLVSNGGAVHVVALDFIVNLNNPYWHSRSLALKNSKAWNSCPFKVEVLP
jgi:hypothetical protein